MLWFLMSLAIGVNLYTIVVAHPAKRAPSGPLCTGVAQYGVVTRLQLHVHLTLT